VQWLYLTISVLLVVACGLFVAAEFAFVTVDRGAVDKAASAGDRRAQGTQRALSSLSTQLSGAQVGITLTNLAIGFLAEPAIASLIEPALTSAGLPTSSVPGIAVALGMVLATLVTMVFGELVPKNLAIARPLGTARATQRVMRLFTTTMAGPIKVLNGSANALVRRLGVEPQEELRSARTPEELVSLVGRSASQGTLDTATAALMQRSVAFSDRTAGEIMTPRVQMVAVDAADPCTAVVRQARQSGRSRFPVIDGDADVVVGVVHVKNAVGVPRAERDTTPVRSVMAPVPEVPTSLPLDPLLQVLRRESFQLAVVVDEYGGTAGVVTAEDVVEEIVGEISDEHDPLDAPVRARPDGSWTLSGLLRPDEVRTLTGIALPDRDEYDTVAGLVLWVLGHLPEAGEHVEVDLPLEVDEDGDRTPLRRARLEVERMAGRRIDRLRVTRVDVPEEDGRRG
jgi:CBS domain containing-hemolysin-like protein